MIQIIFQNVNTKVSRKKDDFDNYNGNQNINRVIKVTVMFDSSERINAVQFVIDQLEHIIAEPYKNDVFKNNYSIITKKRNLLGHETQNLHEGKIIIGTGDHAFEFNDEFCISMRKEVKKYSNSLDSILNHIVDT